MKCTHYVWLLAVVLAVLPHLLVYAAGFGFLVQSELLWTWGVVATTLTLAGWYLIRITRASTPSPELRVEPEWSWPPSGHSAWREVEAIADRVRNEDLPLDRPEPMWAVLREVLDTVARHYHPDSKSAVLQVPVPHVLRIVELVACDLRQAFSERVPGANVLTVNDFLRIRWIAGLTHQIYLMYRLTMLGFNPVSELLRELRGVAMGRVVRSSRRELKRSAVGFCVRKAGYYAIELYSGHLALEEIESGSYRTRKSQKDVDRAEAIQRRLADEPLRVLVVGQVKSGKSSLINALFGDLRAAVDVLPRTRSTEPYILQRDGIPQAIIVDTAGYEATDQDRRFVEDLRSDILQADLLLVVCSALSAARNADRQLLDAIRAVHQQDPHRIMPATIFAVSHIDQLRPLGRWDPPYNLAQPHGAKAERIAAAVQTVLEDLAFQPDGIVVPVCLKEGMVYNVEESLVPAMIGRLPQAQRAKCLRCLQAVHDEEYWRRLWEQSIRSGRLVLKETVDWAAGLIGRTGEPRTDRRGQTQDEMRDAAKP
jgi:predicted GTPase